MKIELTEKQFRRLLDLVYVGNWVMNSTRGDDRIREYDDVESAIGSIPPEVGEELCGEKPREDREKRRQPHGG